jgi:spoIIIJ-associated protein
MHEVERSAPSVEEAIDSALDELGISEQEARIEVIQEARGGFLGRKGQPAVVKVSRLEPAPSSDASARDRVEEGDVVDAGAAEHADDADERDEAAVGEVSELVEEQSETAADFIEGLLEVMGLNSEVEINDVAGVTYVDIWGAESEQDMALLIGRHGQALDALQELVRIHVQLRTGERCQVMVDVEDYRKRRRSQIVRRARDAAGRVVKTGRSESLDPMTSFERKIVHDTVAEMGGLETASEGEEPNRRVVIRRSG